MSRFLQFAGTVVVVAFGGAWVLGLLVQGPGIERAFYVSAGVAVVVQLIAFAFTRAMQPGNVIAGWGMGMIVRVIALVAYGFLATRVFGLALAPALLSFTGFLFVSTLVEPLFLKQ